MIRFRLLPLRALGALALCLTIGTTPAQAQDTPLLEGDETLTLVPAIQGNTEDFLAMAILTSDPDWLEKFQNPGENGPEFLLRPDLPVGEPARLLLFFAGAFPLDGKVNVLCDLRLYHNDELVHEVQPTPCSAADDPGDIARMMLADTTLVITPTEDDIGTFLKIEVGVVDANRGEVVQMELLVVYGNLPE